MKHLVTGGSGYLGNLISGKLVGDGEAVRILDLWEDPERPRAAEFVRADILDRDAVAEALRDIDVVHHTAALVPLAKARREFERVNIEGTRIVAEEAAKAGVRWFVYMSSTAVFEVPEKGPIDASTPLRPCEEYGRTKLVGEQVAREVCERSGIPLLVIRPRTLLGAGRLGLFNLLFDWIADDRTIYTMGDGNNLFQFIHPLDLLDAYMLVLRLGKAGSYNVGTDRFGTLREGFERLIRYAGSRSLLRGLPVGPSIFALRLLDWLRLSPLAPYHYTHYHKNAYFDLTPLTTLGWRPRYSNDDMFREAYDWFLANRKAEAEASSPHRKPVAERVLWLLRKIS